MYYPSTTRRAEMEGTPQIYNIIPFFYHCIRIRTMMIK